MRVAVTNQYVLLTLLSAVLTKPTLSLDDDFTAAPIGQILALS
jgi:hypothetical protein